MATFIKKYSYPQIYFLECEACKHFGLKLRTYKNWLDSGLTIPGRFKVKGSNYYIIKPEEFHQWLIETRLEVATPQNKFHNRKVSLYHPSAVVKSSNCELEKKVTGGGSFVPPTHTKGSRT
tara:strand:+ start:67 stop:429 length:363 start_codon:yes stop_codon:yes gene_type:complete